MNFWALGLALVFQAALPALTGRVVDRAEVLSPDEEASLTRKLESIENETSVQFVVVTIPSLEGDPIEDYSTRLAEEWKIGQAGLDNGAIILVVPSERRIRIEVGYGLEPVIPDGLAGRIIRERIAPAFQAGNYYQGLLAAVEGLELAARREYPEAPATSREEPTVDFNVIVFLFLYFLVAVLGNVIGIVFGVLAGALVFPVVGGSLASLLGLWSLPVGGLLGFFAVLFLRGLGKSGSWTSPGHGSGGYRGGGRGGFSGGFGGGGGFRGGGGSFGGGGASGSW